MNGRTRKFAAEFVGTAFLLATVVGSGIMAERLSGGNVGVALLANSLATGAILFVLITMFGPVSGAHFNPAVTLVAALRRETASGEAIAFVVLQIAGAIVGVWVAHLMFAEDLLQLSLKERSGSAQAFAEAVATFGLILTIIGTVRMRREAVPAAVGLYIMAAYWFTASTSFANPAVTLARALSNTFAGIRPTDVPVFLAAQIAGALVAMVIGGWIFAPEPAPDATADLQSTTN